jgi:hypothetical protein
MLFSMQIKDVQQKGCNHSDDILDLFLRGEYKVHVRLKKTLPLTDDQQKSFHLQHLSSPEPKIRRKKNSNR